MQSIDLVIVEDHNHCLEHIHSVLRRKKIFQSWRMLHFDAHPDLACPTIPALACFTPRRQVDPSQNNLYEMLDLRASGIAEWILPLVLAADLKMVEWVKPSFSRQLPLGKHVFHVGVQANSGATERPNHFYDLSSDAEMRVDWFHPYYLVDDMVTEKTNLDLIQPLHLQVSELIDEVELSFITIDHKNDRRPWVLDICLDYFACSNPYLTDIDKVDGGLTSVFLNVMSSCSLFSEDAYDALDASTSKRYKKRIDRFRQLLESVLIQTEEAQIPPILDELNDFLLPSKAQENPILELRHRMKSHGDQAINSILKAIPVWDMPHAISTSEWETIEEAIHRVKVSLGRLLSNDIIDPPFLICIARSANDGFSPLEVVDRIQSRVIEMLDSLFSSSETCERTKLCTLNIIEDYGEWEGSAL